MHDQDQGGTSLVNEIGVWLGSGAWSELKAVTDDEELPIFSSRRKLFAAELNLCTCVAPSSPDSD
jgi:hypothetical protein